MTGPLDGPADPALDPGAPGVEVVVGRIGKPHGLRGEVTVEVRTDEPDRRFTVGAVLRSEPPTGSAGRAGRPDSLTVLAVRWHQSTLLVTFAELPDRSAAESVRGTLLHTTLAAGDTPEDPDEYYDHQLVGLVAVAEDGAPLGEVVGLLHGGAQDLLRLAVADGHEALVPFVKALVPEVDLAAGRLVIADRPGLLTPLPEEPEGADG